MRPAVTAAPPTAPLPSRLLAEAIGTFALVLAGTGAIVVDDVTGGTLGQVGIALAFGLVAMAMVYAFGEVSGAHLNPAVTLGFVAARRFEPRELWSYVGAQVLGACLASLALRWVFDDHPTLGATLPRVSVGRAFALEAATSWLLMLVVLRMSSGARLAGSAAPPAFGATLAFGTLLAGPVTGASMNPARSLGPALASRATDELWLYLLAPALGALLAVPPYRALRAPPAPA
jgi:aquaporin Z